MVPHWKVTELQFWRVKIPHEDTLWKSGKLKAGASVFDLQPQPRSPARKRARILSEPRFSQVPNISDFRISIIFLHFFHFEVDGILKISGKLIWKSGTFLLKKLENYENPHLILEFDAHDYLDSDSQPFTDADRRNSMNALHLMQVRGDYRFSGKFLFSRFFNFPDSW